MVDAIINSFDVWTDAQGIKSKGRVKSIDNISLEGVARLRELILDLAIRGKLVSQDLNDESANELLKNIKKEKDKLIRKGELKKDRFLSEEVIEDPSILLPSEWRLCSLGKLAKQITDGTHFTPKYVEDGIRFLSVKNISSGKLDFSDTKFISAEEHEMLIKRCEPKRNDILICRIGTLGIPVLINTDEPFSIFVSLGLIKFFPEYVFPEYLRLVLDSPFLWKQYMEIKATGSHTNKLNLRDIPSLKIPIPPFAEQKRIVAKVDELMALCDQLEAQQTNSLKTHQQLVKTLLATLTQAKDADEVQTAWQQLLPHFDILFCTEDSIEQLKQTLLQLAIMGRLVKQDSNDEPASELIKRIEKEKGKLIEEKIYKKNNVFHAIKDEEKFFKLPKNWTYSRLGSFTFVGTGSTPSRDKLSYYNPPEINWVTSGETSQDFIYETLEKVSLLAIKETNVSIYPTGSLVIAMYGQGKTRGQVSELMIDAGTNQACAVVVFIEKSLAHKKYVKYFFKKSYDEIRSNSAGGAQPNLNLGKVASTIIPLPPMAEQERIVAKLDELMALCDQLKNKINKSQQIQNTLSKTIVENAVA